MRDSRPDGFGPALDHRPAQRVVACIGGERPGPTVLVIGALHANEPAGIAAAQQVHRWLRDSPCGLSGRFVAVRGHTRARPSERYVDEDLNRIFTPERLRESRTPRTVEHREALELLELIDGERRAARGPMLVIDLHTTSSASPPFVAFEDALPVRRLVRATGLPMLVGLEECLPGLLFDYIGARWGVHAMVVEGGLHDSPSSVGVLSSAVRLVLDRAGMISLRATERRALRRLIASNAGSLAGAVFDIRYRLGVSDPTLTVPQGIEGFGRVRRGRTVLAIQHGTPQTSPIAGVAIMPNRQAGRRVGDDAVFVATRVGRIWLVASALLRRVECLHRLIPLIAPGVRAIPDRPGVLSVTPRIALVLKREVFHLLGYRILVAGNDVAESGRGRRFVQGIALGVRALGRAVMLPWRRVARQQDGDPAREWIVARRRLDLRARSEKKPAPDGRGG